MAIEIRKDSQIVEVATAAARHERLDSEVVENANKLIKDLASDPNPHNRYQIAQLVKFAVNDMVHRDTNWLDMIADTKRVAFGDKAEFDVKLPGVRAFIQAKGATTPRTKNAQKKFTLETLSVSARPYINIVELQNGLANTADLINYLSDGMRHQPSCAERAEQRGSRLGVPVQRQVLRHWLRRCEGHLRSHGYPLGPDFRRRRDPGRYRSPEQAGSSDRLHPHHEHQHSVG